MLDLTATLFAQRSVPRGDELATHFSDAIGCLRATAYRRRGMKPAPFTQRDLAKFAIGHGFERNVADTLRDAGHGVVHDPEKFVVSGWGLDIGHPDIFVRDENLVIECKTTDAMSPYYPKSHKLAGEMKPVSPAHAVQVAMSALAIADTCGVPVPRAVVLTKYAGVGETGHIEHESEVDAEELRPFIERLAAEVVALTGPEMPLPPAEPRGITPYDECSYCKWSQCERSPVYAPEADVLEIA